MSQQVKCGNCGAMMSPTADGRTYACDYCGKSAQAAIDSQQLADGLKLDVGNAEAFLFQLASALHPGFEGRSRLELQGEKVILFELNLDPDLFVARRETRGLVVQHRKMVRGIALKTTTHPLDKWAQQLIKALAAHANENARVAQVLMRLGVK